MMMLKNINISIILFALILMISCSDIISNYPDLGDGYKFIHEGKYGVSIVDSQNTQVIRNTVLKYNFDSAFIIVSQRPWDSIPGIPVSTLESMTYDERNEAFGKSNFHQFWIIHKKMKREFDENTKTYSNVFGPFSKEEYLQKRKELGVPEELKLDFED